LQIALAQVLVAAAVGVGLAVLADSLRHPSPEPLAPES
jgi:hypothetical protein